MNSDRRDERGRYAPMHTDADVLAVVRERAPAGTKEVAEALGIARQSADYRLRKLADEGRVRSKKVGGSLAWTATSEAEA